jgi:hypothetical protein
LLFVLLLLLHLYCLDARSANLLLLPPPAAAALTPRAAADVLRRLGGLVELSEPMDDSEWWESLVLSLSAAAIGVPGNRAQQDHAQSN